jgi:peroxiredoxin
MRETMVRHEMTWTVLSDAESKAALAFGLAFKVDDRTVDQYKGFGIDLEAASGQTHHVLPVPAVFIVDESGKIEFQYVDPDYRARIPPEVLLAAARAGAK